MSTSTKKIAAMLRKNVDAVTTGKITWQQFGQVNSATWDLATEGHLCIIGSRASRRAAQVHRLLNAS